MPGEARHAAGSVALSIFRFRDTPRVAYSSGRDATGSGSILGNSLNATEPHLIANEEPEVITESLRVMKEHFGVSQSAIAREMRVQPSLLETLLMSSNPGSKK